MQTQFASTSDTNPGLDPNMLVFPAELPGPLYGSDGCLFSFHRCRS